MHLSRLLERSQTRAQCDTKHTYHNFIPIFFFPSRSAGKDQPDEGKVETRKGLRLVFVDQDPIHDGNLTAMVTIPTRTKKPLQHPYLAAKYPPSTDGQKHTHTYTNPRRSKLFCSFQRQNSSLLETIQLSPPSASTFSLSCKFFLPSIVLPPFYVFPRQIISAAFTVLTLAPVGANHNQSVTRREKPETVEWQLWIFVLPLLILRNGWDFFGGVVFVLGGGRRQCLLPRPL